MWLPGALPPVDAGEQNGVQYLGVGAISRTQSPLVSDISQLEKQDGHCQHLLSGGQAPSQTSWAPEPQPPTRQRTASSALSPQATGPLQ